MAGNTSMRTVDALQYAGLERPFFNSVITRKLLTDLPPAKAGREGRLFGPDDLVALEVFGELLRIGVMVHIAARIATDLRGMLRAEPRIQRLHLITVPSPDGTHSAEIVKVPPAEATTLWVIHAAKARQAARAAIAAQGNQ